jgi:hypothetical protein
MSECRSEEFRKKCPKLEEEFGESGTVKIQAVRSSLKEAERAAHSQQGYAPTAVDFIRRCENDGQALEIIDFLESKGEIDPSYAKRLRSQLAEHGLKSFGKRRESGCYERGEMG